MNDDANTLPKLDKIRIPREKFTQYALNPQKDEHKATAFFLALGYDLDNYEKLISNITENITKFPITYKGNNGYGNLYEIILSLTGENGKTAKVLTGWIDDSKNDEFRLTTVHIDK